MGLEIEHLSFLKDALLKQIDRRCIKDILNTIKGFKINRISSQNYGHTIRFTLVFSKFLVESNISLPTPP